MDETNFSSLAPNLFMGRLEGVTVPDLVWEICRRHSTGVLYLRRAGITNAVYVDGGLIVFAATDDPDNRLGEVLLREGLITLEQFEHANRSLAQGRRFGTILVENGHLTPDNLIRSVLSQVRAIVMSVFSWEEGVYRFEEGPLPTDEVITLQMQTQELLLQGIRSVRSFDLIRRSAGHAWTRYALTPGWREVLGGVQLTDGEELLLERLESGPQSVENLCQEVFLSNFEICQALWACKVLGIIESIERPTAIAIGGRNDGRLEREGFAELLVRLCHEGDTGVLRVNRGAMERTFQIKEGRCVFATSNSMDDGLVFHLFRRGVISLRDQERVAKRLLTNKRVGTILMELGVLDERDLQETVREQVREIVYDTVRWADGEFAFYPGELPTVEEITLNSSVEDLVSNALRQVTSWRRIVEGCGAPDTTLGLAPGYLHVLDRMSVGTEEWEVVAALKVPRKVRDVCRAARMGDFRVCQILWTLRLLGAVEESPAETIDQPADPGQDTARGLDVAAALTADAAEESWPTEPVAHELQEPEPESARPATLDEQPVEAAPARSEVSEQASDPAAVPGFDEPRTPLDESDEPAPDRSQQASFEESPEEPREEAVEPIELAETGRQSAQDEDAPVGDLPYVTRFLRVEEEVPDSPDEGDAYSADAELAPPAEAPEAPRGEEGFAPADQIPPEQLEDFEPDPELDRQIASFNARQRVVYRTIRSEVGAGAANFVRFCSGRLTDGFDRFFARVQLLEDGSWDAMGLKWAMRVNRIHDPWLPFQRLLDREMEMVHVHMGDDKAEALRSRLEEVERAYVSAAQTALPPE